MSVPYWAVRGAKVVLVDANFRGDTDGLDLPELDQVYTIRDVTWNPYWREWQIRLVEVVNQPQLYNIGLAEAAWRISRFRPAVSLEDDIAAHFAHLLTTPVREGV